MGNPIVLAVIAALFYGFGGPLMKAAHHAGMSVRDFVFLASLSSLIISAFWITGDTVLFSKNQTIILSICGILMLSIMFLGNAGSVPGILVALPGMIFLSCGFIFLNRALAIPFSLASVILIITSSNPLIASSLSLMFLNEAKKVNLTMLFLGAMFVVTGTILVSLSTKSH